MPSFRRRTSVIDADRDDKAVGEPAKKPDDADKVRALAEEAEAEAAEAEAIAAAARARARAIRLRREAVESTTAATAVAGGTEPDTADNNAAEAEPLEAEAVESDTVEADADSDSQATAEGEESAAEQDADAPAEEAQEKPAGRRWGRVIKVAAMSLAILLTGALLTASGYMVWQHRQAVEQQQLNAEYAAAGRQSVVTLMSLDFNAAEQNVQSIIENSTGQFKTDFESQAQDFIKVAQDSKVVTDVTVNSTAVESMDQDSAVVLVAATSRVTNSAGAEQEPRAWRLSVDLQREGDQIKMSKVEFVP